MNNDAEVLEMKVFVLGGKVEGVDGEKVVLGVSVLVDVGAINVVDGVAGIAVSV